MWLCVPLESKISYIDIYIYISLCVEAAAAVAKGVDITRARMLRSNHLFEKFGKEEAPYRPSSERTLLRPTTSPYIHI